jgi:hypothetical protein
VPGLPDRSELARPSLTPMMMALSGPVYFRVFAAHGAGDGLLSERRLW